MCATHCFGVYIRCIVITLSNNHQAVRDLNRCVTKLSKEAL
jgi:hypothetical protein